MGPVSLPRSGLVYFDSAPLIYTIENHPRYAPLLAQFWLDVRASRIVVATSEFTLLEALVGAFRKEDETLASTYRAIREDTAFKVIPVSPEVIEKAAKQRAQHPRLRVPDAVHVATAGIAGCDAFITNDKALRSVPLPNVVVLDDLLP